MVHRWGVRYVDKPGEEKAATKSSDSKAKDGQSKPKDVLKKKTDKKPKAI